jgi:predicted RNA-binding Zn-ribbon protein involved in translation (DUF1610 family)
MPSDYDDNLLRQGLIHFKVGETDLARRYLERALENADDLGTRARVCFYLSELSQDPQQKRKFLEESLAIDPMNPEARRRLAILDGRLKAEEIVDADALPARSASLSDVQTDRFTCPTCGGRMLYAPDGASLVCEYCAGAEKLGTAPGGEQDFFIAMAVGKGHRTPTLTRVFHCQGCGVDFLFASLAMTATCSYCGSAHVVALEKARQLVAPDIILPMAFDQAEAAHHLSVWLVTHRIHPQGELLPPRGLYLPVWVFHVMGSVPWSGTIVKNKQQVPVSGDKAVIFHDLYVPAVRKLPGFFEKLLQEYTFSSTPAYDPRFLAGWPAEVYEIAMSDASLEARRQAVKRIRRSIHEGLGYVSDLRYSSSSIAVDSFQLALVPLWMTEIRLQDRICRVTINGQTGSTHGEAPQSGLRSWLEDLLGT